MATLFLFYHFFWQHWFKHNFWICSTQLWYNFAILCHFASPWTFPWLPRCAGTLLHRIPGTSLPSLREGLPGPSGFEAVVFSTGDSLVAMWCLVTLELERSKKHWHIPRGVSMSWNLWRWVRCLYWLYWMLKYQVQFLLLFQPQNAE